MNFVNKRALWILIFSFHLTLLMATGPIRLGVVGKGTPSSERLLDYLLEQRAMNKLNLATIAYAPSYSYENKQNAVELIPYSVRTSLSEKGISRYLTLDSLLKEVDTVILESYEGSLDFNSAFQVLEAGKNLLLEEPKHFDPSDLFVLFSLSKKYRVELATYTTSNLHKYSINFTDFDNSVIGSSLLHEYSIKSLSTKQNLAQFIYFDEELIYATMHCGKETRLLEIPQREPYEEVLSFLLEAKGNAHERYYLKRAILSYLLNSEESASPISLKNCYMHAFDSAYKKMNRFH